MTQHAHDTPQGSTPEQQSLSGLLDHPDLLRVRILPAQFARALGVSKQSTSRWVRDGWVTLGADGRLDPAVAIGQLLRRCDPGRLRARWLRQAVTEVQELRDNLAKAEARAEATAAALGEAIGQLAKWKKWTLDGERSVEIFQTLIIEQADRLRAASAEAWPAILEELLDAATLAADPPGAEDDDLADFIAAVDAPRAVPENEGGGADAAATQVAAPQPQPKGAPND